MEKERKKAFKISKVDRFRYRTRYFTDSGSIGTEEFVFTDYHRLMDIFMSKREKIPKAVAGLDWIYFVKKAGAIKSLDFDTLLNSSKALLCSSYFKPHLQMTAPNPCC